MNQSNSLEEQKKWQAGELSSERNKNVWRTKNYVVPLIERLFPLKKEHASLRILSAGCGNGEDVDTLIEERYNAVGIDPGYRSEEWQRRKHPECFQVGDARNLPFEDGSFDLVLNFGVIEHIGAVGDTLEMLPDYEIHRQKFARELSRVTKPGGYILVATNNQLCPFDLWHGVNRWGVRPHSSNEKFSVSFKIMKTLFCGQGGCDEAVPLGLENFFQYQKVSQHGWIKFLLFPIKIAIALISRAAFLRASFLNPFLIVLFRKKK